MLKNLRVQVHEVLIKANPKGFAVKDSGVADESHDRLPFTVLDGDGVGVVLSCVEAAVDVTEVVLVVRGCSPPLETCGWVLLLRKDVSHWPQGKSLALVVVDDGYIEMFRACEEGAEYDSLFVHKAVDTHTHTHVRTH